MTTLPRVRTAVLVSGRGSNLAALIEAARDPGYPAGIVLVASNRPGAPGLDRAREAGIAAVTVDHKAFADRESFERALDAALREHRVELLALAGFMRVLTPWFIEAWRERMINIHPSLLPAFRGLHTHQRALEEGVLLHGCTVHRVVPDLDAGPILGQAAVPVLPGDDAGRLAARVLAAEHRLYPVCLAVAARRLRGEPAGIAGDADPSATLVNVGH